MNYKIEHKRKCILFNLLNIDILYILTEGYVWQVKKKKNREFIILIILRKEIITISIIFKIVSGVFFLLNKLYEREVSFLKCIPQPLNTFYAYKKKANKI